LFSYEQARPTEYSREGFTPFINSPARHLRLALYPVKKQLEINLNILTIFTNLFDFLNNCFINTLMKNIEEMTLEELGLHIRTIRNDVVAVNFVTMDDVEKMFQDQRADWAVEEKELFKSAEFVL